MLRDNRFMYMVHVCFYVCCSDCVRVCGNVYCVSALLKIVVFSLGVLKYVLCLALRGGPRIASLPFTQVCRK